MNKPAKPTAIRFKEEEIAELKKAAARSGRGWTTFVRETALAHARRVNSRE
tara:strand:+ start:246 stop:398 length:153 start_codon:yes stop_codon:yes gene_type:complete